MEYKDFKRLNTASKAKIKVDMDLFYKAEVVNYPIRFMKPSEEICKLHAFYVDADRTIIKFRHQNAIEDFDTVEEAVEDFMLNLEIENKGIKDIKVGFPYIKEEQ